jgi:hypothetical protein
VPREGVPTLATFRSVRATFSTTGALSGPSGILAGSPTQSRAGPSQEREILRRSGERLAALTMCSGENFLPRLRARPLPLRTVRHGALLAMPGAKEDANESESAPGRERQLHGRAVDG